MKKIDVNKPNQLKIKNIAHKLDIDIYYGGVSLCFENNIILARSTKEKEWQDFGHELCHFLRHSGNQTNMSELFRDLQENQATYFSYQFCVPTFMLKEIKNPSVNLISEYFNVDHDFARRRLLMFKNKMYFRNINTVSV